MRNAALGACGLMVEIVRKSCETVYIFCTRTYSLPTQNKTKNCFSTLFSTVHPPAFPRSFYTFSNLLGQQFSTLSTCPITITNYLNKIKSNH